MADRNNIERNVPRKIRTQRPRRRDPQPTLSPSAKIAYLLDNEYTGYDIRFPYPSSHNYHSTLKVIEPDAKNRIIQPTTLFGDELAKAIVPDWNPVTRQSRDEQQESIDASMVQEIRKISSIVAEYNQIVKRDVTTLFGTQLYMQVDWDSAIDPITGGLTGDYEDLFNEIYWWDSWREFYPNCRGNNNLDPQYCPAYCRYQRDYQDHTYPDMKFDEWYDNDDYNLGPVGGVNRVKKIFEEDVFEQFLSFLECYLPIQDGRCDACGDGCEHEYDANNLIIDRQYKVCFADLWDVIQDQEWLRSYDSSNLPDMRYAMFWPCIQIRPSQFPQWTTPPYGFGEIPGIQWQFDVELMLDNYEPFDCSEQYLYDTQGGVSGYGYGEEMCCGFEYEYDRDTFYGVCQNSCNNDPRCTWEPNENSALSSDGYYILGDCKNDDCGDCEDIRNMELCLSHDLCEVRPGNQCVRKNLECDEFSQGQFACEYLMEYCGLDSSECMRWCENNPRGDCQAYDDGGRVVCNGCPPDRPVQCPDGQCVVHPFSCAGCPTGFVICPDMTCAPALEYCNGDATEICCDEHCATNFPFLSDFGLGNSLGGDANQMIIESCTAGYGPCNFTCCGYWYPDIFGEGGKGSPPVHPLVNVNHCCEYTSGCATPGYKNTWSTNPYDQETRGFDVGATAHNNHRVIDWPRWNGDPDMPRWESRQHCNALFNNADGFYWEDQLNWHAGPNNDCVCITHDPDICTNITEPFGYPACESEIGPTAMEYQFCGGSDTNWATYYGDQGHGNDVDPEWVATCEAFQNKHYYSVSSIAHEYDPPVKDGFTGERGSWFPEYEGAPSYSFNLDAGGASTDYVSPPMEKDCRGECTCNKVCGQIRDQYWADYIIWSGYGREYMAENAMEFTNYQSFYNLSDNPNIDYFPLKWEHFGWEMRGNNGVGEGHYLQPYHGEFKFRGGWFNEQSHKNVETHQDYMNYGDPDDPLDNWLVTHMWHWYQMQGHLAIMNIFPPPLFCQDLFDMDTARGKHDWQYMAGCKSRTNACVSQIDDPDNNQFAGLGKCARQRDEEHVYAYTMTPHPRVIYDIKYDSELSCKLHCCSERQGGNCNNECNEGVDTISGQRYWSCCNVGNQFRGTLSCSGFGGCG
jgi:hypothetical protein